LQYHAANPYHNYAHATDVVTCVYRWFRMNRAVEWLDEMDQLSLLVAAMAHDIAHPGRTSPFLIETSHELAIRYNDRSPLENMHCSKLFEITKKEAFDIFSKFDSGAYRKLRKTCINAIIHTDNALHFDMVKQVNSTYDMVSDICDNQANHSEGLLENYLEVLKSKDNATLWQQIILHLCDVATPLKPWAISMTWARCVQDEFFNQGDEEKQLGLPVGFLNDRYKVNRNSSEHGFINFLVAPLTIATTSLFPYMQPLAEQMCKNIKAWRDLWVEDSKPSQDDVDKKDADITKLKESVAKLDKRSPAVTIRTGT